MSLPFKMNFAKLRPALHSMSPEMAHMVTIKALRFGLTPRQDIIDDPRLNINLCGLALKNPIGLAAGFDKNAEAIKGLFELGFGAVEVGTVTPNAQEGNPSPRVFRDKKNNAVINRMGFPNQGLRVFKENIEDYLNSNDINKAILGLNIGMNKDQTNPGDDYCNLISALNRYADYFTINISSPNTPGLRNLQQRDNLLPLIEQIKASQNKLDSDKKPPLFIKLAPDLKDDEREEIAETLIEAHIDGVILSNTTLDRPEFLDHDFKGQAGGLSGAPLTQKSTKIIEDFYRYTKGQLPIIGVGGISNAQDAYDKICAGASCIQIYSALIFQGPDLIPSINKGILELLSNDGFSSISKAVGSKNKI